MNSISEKYDTKRYFKCRVLTSRIEGGEAMQDDSRIIALLQKRDEQALKLIKEQYGILCHQIAFRMTGNNEDAEECVNDMLMNIWNSVPPVIPDDLKTYAASLVRRSAVNRYKHEHRQKRGGTQLAEVIDELAEILPSSECVEQKVEQRELTAALNTWIKTLPPENRRIFMQRYFMSETVQTIAEKNHMTENSVKMRLMRIRSKLKKYLRKEGLL